MTLEEIKKLRQKRNQEILEKLKNGENLASFDKMQSFFPDRSKGFIKKDKETIKKLYGISKEDE